AQMDRGKHLQLTFSQTKSELMHCIPQTGTGAARDISKIKPLTLPDRTITPSAVVRYLGVDIDRSTTFQIHATNAASKGRQMVGRLSFLSTGPGRIKPFIAYHLALTSILPKMLWASPAWWNGYYLVRTAIETTFHTIARWIAGLPQNTRTQLL